MNQTLISFPLGMLKSPAVIESRTGMDLKQITVYQEWFPNAFVFMLPELGELSTSREIITTSSSVYISIVKVNIFKVFFFIPSLEYNRVGAGKIWLFVEDTSTYAFKIVVLYRNILIQSREELWFPVHLFQKLPLPYELVFAL